MSRAVSYRLPEDLVIAVKDAAAQTGMSSTEYVRRSIEARLNAPALIEIPMVPRDTAEVQAELCAHPFRDEHNVCRICGEQR